MSATGEFEELSQRILSYSPECIKILDLEGHLLDMNANGQQLLGIEDFESVRGTFWPDIWLGADRAQALAAVAAARTGGAARFVGFFTTLHGLPKWWDVVVTALPDEAGEPERIIAVSRDVTDQRRSESYFRFLAEIGATLNGALDAEGTLEEVAQAVVRSVADFCVFDMLDEKGRVRRVVSAHRDPGAAPAVRRIAEMDPVGSPHLPTAVALRTLEPVLAAAIDGEADEASDDDAERSALWRSLAISSAVTVPILIDKKAIGVMGLAVSGRSYGFDERDISLAQELARQVAATLQSVRRYARELRVATTLQAAAIPHRLPSVPEISFDAIYDPASDEAAIGGDWYDAFELEDGRVVVTIGDVMGHGIDAAVTMGSIRQSLRAAAMMRGDPRQILDVADRTLRMDDPMALATALVAIVDRATMTLSCALAGHPAPLLRRAGGSVEVPFVSGGLMLGLRTGAEPAVQTVSLAPGDLLVVVTDGILEQSHDIRAGERALAAAIARPEIYADARPARALLEALRGDDTTDDIAILTMRVN